MQSLLTLLSFLGITPDQYPFLVLAILIVGGIVCLRVSIVRPLETKLDRITDKLAKMKDNIVVIVAHLSANASARGRLNTALIQVMSPMMITDQGKEVLIESGFTIS